MKSRTPGGWDLLNSRQRLLEFCQEQPCFTDFTCTPYGRGQFRCKLVIRIFSVFKEYTSSHRGSCKKEVIDRASMKLLHKIFKIGLIECFGQPRKSLLSGNQIPTVSDIEVARQAANAFLSQDNTNTQPIAVNEPSTSTRISTEDTNLPVVHKPSTSTRVSTEDTNLRVLANEPSTPARISTEDTNLPVVHKPSTSTRISTEDTNLRVLANEPSTPARISTEDTNLPVVHKPSTSTTILTEDTNLPVVVHKPSTQAGILEEKMTEKDTGVIKKMLHVTEDVDVAVEDMFNNMTMEQISEILNNYGEKLRTLYIESMEKKVNNVMLRNATVFSNIFKPQYGTLLETGDSNQELLDIIILLAISPVLRLSFNHHSGKESNLVYKICKCFDDSLKAVDEDGVGKAMKKALAVVLEDVWMYMEKITAAYRGANNYTKLLAQSPAAGYRKVLETLIISESCIHKAFDNQVRWIHRCRVCHYEEPDTTQRVSPFSFPHIIKSFHPFSKDTFFRTRCPNCTQLGFRSNLTFEKLAPCFVMHFEDKFPITCLGGFDFKVCGATYKLTSFLSAGTGGVWLRKKGGWLPFNDSSRTQTKVCKENAKLLFWEKDGAKELINKVPTSTDEITNFFKPLIINPGTKTLLMKRSKKRSGAGAGNRLDVRITYPENLEAPIGDFRLPSAEKILATDNVDKLLTYASYARRGRKYQKPASKRLMKQINETREEYKDDAIDLDDDNRKTRRSTRNTEPRTLCEDELFPESGFGDSGCDSEFDPKPKRKKKNKKNVEQVNNLARSFMKWYNPTSNVQLLDDDQIQQFKKNYARENTAGKMTRVDVKGRFIKSSTSSPHDGYCSSGDSTTSEMFVPKRSNTTGKRRVPNTSSIGDSPFFVACSFQLEKKVPPSSGRGVQSPTSSRGSSPDLDSVRSPRVEKLRRKMLKQARKATNKLPVETAINEDPDVQSDTPATQVTEQDCSLTNLLSALDPKSAQILKITPSIRTLPTTLEARAVLVPERDPKKDLPQVDRQDDGFRRGDGKSFAPFAFGKSKKTKKDK